MGREEKEGMQVGQSLMPYVEASRPVHLENSSGNLKGTSEGKSSFHALNSHLGGRISAAHARLFICR